MNPLVTYVDAGNYPTVNIQNVHSATESFLGGAEDVVRPLGAVHSTDMEQKTPSVVTLPSVPLSLSPVIS